MQATLLVLASNSPRRRELMGFGGWKFETRPAEVDESASPGESPREYVVRLAISKAQACTASLGQHPNPSPSAGWIILAADTIVVDGNTLLGKPGNADQAVRMLRRLRNRTHQVLTGIALLRPADGNLLTDLCVTQVPMRDYRDEEMHAYVASRDPFDKAGGYAIQHPGFHPVETFSGCYASVMGLPLCHLARTLAKFNVPTQADIPGACRTKLDYNCPIYATILGGGQVG